MREITKIVKHTIDDQEYSFQIQKMDALQGGVLLKFLTEKLLPMFDQIQVLLQSIKMSGNETDEEKEKLIKQKTVEALSMITGTLESISDDDMINLMRKCLRTVYVSLPAGFQPVMVGNNFGFPEVEYDIGTCLTLCYEVIEFNTESFFGESGLISALKRLNIRSRNA